MVCPSSTTYIVRTVVAAAIITTRQGLFAEHETSWVNCTSALLLGHFLALLLKEKDQGKLETERTLKRFAKDQGWRKFKDWVGMAKQHPRFAQAELVGETLDEWQSFFQNSRVSADLCCPGFPSETLIKLEISDLAKEIVGLMATVTTSTWLMVERHR